MSDYYLEIDGHCPICEHSAVFIAKHSWLRGALICQTCKNGSVPRERALAFVLNRMRPNWRELTIHECSPASRGISAKMKSEASNYVGTHYYPDKETGSIIDGFRNESIEETTFADNSFDIVVSLDVWEHIWRPSVAARDIYRTLKPGGIYLSTFPIRKNRDVSHAARASLRPDGTIEHHEEPEIHGNPIDGSGSLVTWDYGYDIHKSFMRWAPFEVEISRFAIPRLGIVGEYLDVAACTRPVEEMRNRVEL